MLEKELIELAKNIQMTKAEGQTIEVKAATVDCPKNLYDTLSSFSNQDQGGIVVFGLDEKQDFLATGVYDVQDLQKTVTEQCNQMHPPVRAVFTHAIFNGVNICSTEIPSVDYILRPCYYSGLGKYKGSYLRVGDADIPMTDYELYKYEAYKEHTHDDERPIVKVIPGTLKTEEINNFILKAKIDKPLFSSLDDNTIKEMLSITNKGLPTLSTVLNFCVYPQGYFPQLCITAISVPGLSIGDTGADSERFTYNKRIEGTISQMLDEAIAFCTRSMKTKTIINPKTGKREDKDEYPIKAIREIIINALIHRDYSSFTEGTPIQICFFSNRLEIHSPGGLYGKTTVEELGKTRPDIRNPALARMCEMLLQTENRYSGIPTIIKEMKEAGLREPVFENRINEFVVTLYNDSMPVNKVLSDDDIIDYCKEPRSRKEIADFLGIDTVYYVMDKYINPLLQKDLLKMTYPDKPKSKKQKYYSSY